MVTIPGEWSGKAYIDKVEDTASGSKRCILEMPESNGIFGQYGTAVFLTEQQLERINGSLGPAVTYDVSLVRGKMKQNNAYSDKLFGYYWNIRLFDGIMNPQATAIPDDLDVGGVAPDTYVPSAPAIPSTATYREDPSMDSQKWGYNTANGLEAASRMGAATVGELMHNAKEIACALYEMQSDGYIKTKKYIEPLFEEETKPSFEPEWSYPSTENVTTQAQFNQYVKQAGWNDGDILGWLSGAETVDDWLSINKKRTLAKALDVCIDAAEALGLEAPGDFREPIAGSAYGQVGG